MDVREGGRRATVVIRDNPFDHCVTACEPLARSHSQWTVQLHAPNANAQPAADGKAPASAAALSTASLARCVAVGVQHHSDWDSTARTVDMSYALRGSDCLGGGGSVRWPANGPLRLTLSVDTNLGNVLISRVSADPGNSDSEVVGTLNDAVPIHNLSECRPFAYVCKTGTAITLVE
jgi:hypothetical protein